jgi:hypothetical protein
MLATDDEIETFDSEEQPWNAPAPIEPEEIFILVSEEQFLNATFPIDERPDGRLTVLRSTQFWNAPELIVLTDEGIRTEVISLSAKAFLPIAVTVRPSIVDGISMLELLPV